MSQSTPQFPHSSKIPPGAQGAHPEDLFQDSTLPNPTSEYEKESVHRLVLTLEGEIVREYSLNSSNLSIGRKHGNDILLNDLTLSGYHAQISRNPDYVFIEDLESTNGTLVNGNHVNRTIIGHGDIIQIGHHQLTYLCENDAKYEPTMFIKAEHDETQFIYSDYSGGEIPVKGLRLGGLRALGNTVTTPVMELRKPYNTIGYRGKCMALITRATKGYSITTVNSNRSRRASDIPLLNGIPITNIQHDLEIDDVISVAGHEIQFYFLN
jgi:hypothetical protein